MLILKNYNFLSYKRVMTGLGPLRSECRKIRPAPKHKIQKPELIHFFRNFVAQKVNNYDQGQE